MKVEKLIEALNLLDEDGKMDVVLQDIDDDDETATKSISSVEALIGIDEDGNESSVIAITF